MYIYYLTELFVEVALLFLRWGWGNLGRATFTLFSYAHYYYMRKRFKNQHLEGGCFKNFLCRFYRHN